MELYEDVSERGSGWEEVGVGDRGGSGGFAKRLWDSFRKKEKKGAAAWWKQGQVSADSPPWSGVVGRVNASAS